jgi:type IX secretion system PorP/SprF family membrane protein
METANKYILRYFILTIINISILFSVNAQDPQFSQFYSSPLYLAPSFAGTSGGGRLIINYRDQWPRLTSTFITAAFSADYYLEKYRSGVGLLLLRDDAGNGLMNLTRLGLNYSFNFNITQKWKFRPGLQAYYYWESIDYSFLTFGDQILRSGNGGSTPGSSIEMDKLLSTEPVSHIDFTTSLLAYSDLYWFGFTMDHLMFFSNTLASGGDYIPFRYAAFGGGKYHIKSKTIRRKEESVTVAFNFFTQKNISYLDLGTYYTHEPLNFGIWYRGLPVFPGNPNLGAITLLLGYKFAAFRLGYSYDFTISKLITQTGGAHEVSVIYSFVDKKRKKVKHKALPCPGM